MDSEHAILICTIAITIVAGVLACGIINTLLETRDNTREILKKLKDKSETQNKEL